MLLSINLNRKFTSYLIEDYLAIKTKVLNYSKKFGAFCFLDNHEYDFKKSYDCIVGAGSMSHLVADSNSGNLDALDKFLYKKNDWVFGHVSYDIKNEIEELSSSNFDGIQYPQILFFVPEIVFILSYKELKIGVYSPKNEDKIFAEINVYAEIEENKIKIPPLKSRFTRTQYIETVKKLKQHILKGDCYEINFCQEFYTSNATLDPIKVYSKLNKFSPNPFSAFYKYKDKFLMCASPERFLKKTGSVLTSQPMKGTSKRIIDDKDADEIQKNALLYDDKERSENIMIVDLVRNDLSKVCEEGSVMVEEFLGIHTFPQVHQMISTVSGILKEDIKISDIFRATFPMGSMTGAPKKKVMDLIDRYEKTKRGLFSGTVGYIDPEGNFDFNVVIRSLQYNSTNKYLSAIAGSAITFNSIPENEYDECLLKISALKKALG